jgi:hypothetical protein
MLKRIFKQKKKGEKSFNKNDFFENTYKALQDLQEQKGKFNGSISIASIGEEELYTNILENISGTLQRFSRSIHKPYPQDKKNIDPFKLPSSYVEDAVKDDKSIKDVVFNAFDDFDDFDDSSNVIAKIGGEFHKMRDAALNVLICKNADRILHIQNPKALNETNQEFNLFVHSKHHWLYYSSKSPLPTLMDLTNNTKRKTALTYFTNLEIESMDDIFRAPLNMNCLSFPCYGRSEDTKICNPFLSPILQKPFTMIERSERSALQKTLILEYFTSSITPNYLFTYFSTHPTTWTLLQTDKATYGIFCVDSDYNCTHLLEIGFFNVFKGENYDEIFKFKFIGITDLFTGEIKIYVANVGLLDVSDSESEMKAGRKRRVEKRKCKKIKYNKTKKSNKTKNKNRMKCSRRINKM